MWWVVDNNIKRERERERERESGFILNITSDIFKIRCLQL